jgi:hypothetical protein
MSNKIPVTSYGRLLRKMKKTPMTRKEMTVFLLKESGQKYTPGLNHDAYNSSLYGTRSRCGLLEQYCFSRSDRRWVALPNAPEDGPFTQYR